MQIVIDQLDEVMQALALFPTEVGRELEKTTKAALLSLVADLKQYPLQPSGSRYTRTNNLARGWGANVAEFQYQGDATTFEASLTNILARTKRGESYGPYVQDADEQSLWNRHWTTIQDILKNHQSELDEYFRAMLDRIALRLAGLT